jgi:hypothetical protein
VAVNAAAPEAPTPFLSLALSRLAAVPAWLALTGVVAASFCVRLLAVLAHATPLYFPDEYIYGTLARSIAETGRPAVRGTAAHFPALLEPLLAAPFWLGGDAAVAYRLTQGLNVLAMSLAAVPVYLLVRRLGLGKGFGLAAAALAVACPDLLYASFVMADPIAYPLVLGALCAGVYALDRPTRRAQLAFVALSGLATFARVQYVIIPFAFVGAAVLLDRRRVLRVQRLPLVLFATPVVGVVGLGPSRVLGYYSGIAHMHVSVASMAHWAAVDAMMLAYSAGWVIVPGALVGLAYALVRPRARVERGFAALVVLFGAGLFVEAALYAASGSTRYQERYLFTLLPLVAPAFGLYVARGWPRRLAVALIAVSMIALSARVPLSGFAEVDNKQDSPFLFAVFRAENFLGIANGALLVAGLAALLSLTAIAIVRRSRGVALALGLTLVGAAAVSLGAFSFDARNARNVRTSHLPPDARWIDHSGLRSVVLVNTPNAPRGRSLEHLFWNRSVTGVALLKGAPPTDAFGADQIRVGDDGSLLVHERPLRRPVLLESYGVRAVFRGAELVARGSSLELWRPIGTPRLAFLASGLFYDGWLARTGSVTVWPDASGRARGSLTLRLSLPADAERMPLHFRAPGVDRTVSIAPGETKRVTFRFSTKRPWRVVFRTTVWGELTDGRQISVRSGEPQLDRGGFTASAPACSVGPATLQV